MASADTLSAPGAVSYSSDTMVVGDGTWDFTKNTFLLPNLVGLNFDTMQYNGMAILPAPDHLCRPLTRAWLQAWEIVSQPYRNTTA